MSALDVIKMQVGNAIRHAIAGEWTIPETVDEIVEIFTVYNMVMAKNATKGGDHDK